MTTTVDFAPNDTQRAIVRAAAGVLDGTGGEKPDLAWRGLAQAGLLSLAVPSRLGGEGLGAPEIGVLLTEIGRRGLALPALPTLALGLLPIARWGTSDQQQDLLSPLDTGDRVLTAALREPSDPMPLTPATYATADLAVTGTKIGVWYAEQAHRILVPITRSTGGTAVALIDPAGPGVRLRRTPASSGLPEYTVELDEAPAGGLLDCDAAALYRTAIAGACALGDGLLAGALALTTAHVGSREQFGRPLATFQAVAQQIADVYVTARTLHLAVVAACWALGSGRPAHHDLADDDLAVAAQWLTAEAPPALRSCHHLHGGLGLAADYPLHRHTALVRDLVRLLGGSEHCVQRLGERVAQQPG